MMRDTAFLLANGVSMAEAMRLSPVRRLALIVAIGEQKGERFDWRAMQFVS